MSKSPRKTEQFHVMKRDYGAAGGYTRIASYRTKAKAEKIAADLDPTLNGRPTRAVVAWNQEQFDQWHEAEIMPYYRERRA